MKKYIAIGILLVLAFTLNVYGELISDELISAKKILDGVHPELEITNPVIADTFTYTNNISIQWIATDSSFATNPIKIYYTSISTPNLVLIDSSVINDSLYNWIIPDLPSDFYKFKIEAIDSFGNISSDFSDSVYIVEKNPNPVWYISPKGNDLSNNGTFDFPFSSIQRAIDLCDQQDTIRVLPGTYNDTINTSYKNTYITSDSGWTQTTITGDSSATDIITINDNSVITGFTINNSGVGANVAAIKIIDGAPLISHNKIIQNNINIFCSGPSSPTIKNNIICEANQLISGNDQSVITIENNSISYGNEGIIINNSQVTANIINNIISNNNGLGGIVTSHSPSNLNIQYNLLGNNSTDYVGLTDLNGIDGNLSGNPDFIFPDTLNFHLQSTSPAINNGNPVFQYSNEPEPNGDQINMGAFGNTNQAQIASLEFNIPIDSVFEDSSYLQLFGIPIDQNVTYQYSTTNLPPFLDFNQDTTGLEGTPINNEVGTFQVNIDIADNFGRSDTLDYFLTVHNTIPEFETQPDTIAQEDVAYIYDANSTDDGQGTILYHLVRSPAWINLDSLSGELTGTPLNQDVGVDSVVLSVNDGNGGVATQNFRIHVQNTNDAPVLMALPDTISNEDCPITILFHDWNHRVTDVDNNVDSLSWNILSSDHTSSEIFKDSAIITIEKNWFGLDTLSVIVADSTLSDTNIFAINILPVNDPPTWTIFQDTTFLSTTLLTIPLPDFSNDIDDPPDSLTYSYTTDFVPLDYDLNISLDSLNNLILEPGLKTEFTNKRLIVSIEDTSGSIALDTISISVEKYNFPPVLATFPAISGFEDTTMIVLIDTLKQYVSDQDDEIDTLGWLISSTENLFTEIQNDSIFITPDTNWFGSEFLTISVFDEKDTTTGDIKVIFSNIPDAPQFSLNPLFHFNEDESLKISLDTLVTDVDSPIESMEWQISFDPFTKSNLFPGDKDSLTLVLNNQDRTVIFSAQPNYFGDSIMVYYSVKDTSQLTTLDSNYISVLPINDAPIVPKYFTMDDTLFEDVAFKLNLNNYDTLVYDLESPNSLLQWTLSDGIFIHPIILVSHNIYMLNSNQDWYGIDTLLVNISDGEDTSTVKLPIELQPVNDPPQISNIPDTLFNEDDSLYFSLDDYVSDVECHDSLLSWSVQSTDTNYLYAEWDSLRKEVFLYGKPDKFINHLRLEYSVYDTNHATDSSSGFISILPVNDAPVILSVPDTNFYEDNSLYINHDSLFSLVQDIDNLNSELTITISKDSGTVFHTFLGDTGLHKFWANLNDDSLGYFSFTVNDPDNAQTSENFTVDIIPVNDPPVLYSHPDTVSNQDTVFTILLKDYIFDPDNDFSELIWEFKADTSQIINNQSDTLLITPPVNYVGNDSIYLSVTDTSGITDTDTFKIFFRDAIPPTFNIGIFQNPVASEYLDFYFFPKEEIISVDSVFIDYDDKEVTLIDSITPAPYFCRHRVRYTNIFPVIITARDTTGNSGTTNYEFSATGIFASKGGTVSSPDSLVTLIIPDNSLNRDNYILCLPDAKIYKTANNKLAKIAEETSQPSYKFSGPQKNLNKTAKLIFRQTDASIQNNRPGIFHKTIKGWEYIETFTDENHSAFWIYTSSLGEYKIAGDSPQEPICIPTKVALSQNYPNPFNPNTKINFSLPEKGNGMFREHTSLIVYDLLGREVVKLINKPHTPGYYTTVWNSTNSSGKKVASGMYIYRLQYGQFYKSKKMVLLK